MTLNICRCTWGFKGLNMCKASFCSKITFPFITFLFVTRSLIWFSVGLNRRWREEVEVRGIHQPLQLTVHILMNGSKRDISAVVSVPVKVILIYFLLNLLNFKVSEVFCLILYFSVKPCFISVPFLLVCWMSYFLPCEFLPRFLLVFVGPHVSPPAVHCPWCSLSD